MSDFEKAFEQKFEEAAQKVFDKYKQEIMRGIEDDPEARERQIKVRRILAKPSVLAEEMAYVLECSEGFLMNLAEQARRGENDFPILDLGPGMIRFEPLKVLEWARNHRSTRVQKPRKQNHSKTNLRVLNSRHS